MDTDCVKLWYLAAAKHRPGRIRVNRLLGDHGIGADTAEVRVEGFTAADLAQRREGDPVKLALAARLRRAFAAPKWRRPRRRETTLTVG